MLKNKKKKKFLMLRRNQSDQKQVTQNRMPNKRNIKEI